MLVSRPVTVNGSFARYIIPKGSPAFHPAIGSAGRLIKEGSNEDGRLGPTISTCAGVDQKKKVIIKYQTVR